MGNTRKSNRNIGVSSQKNSRENKEEKRYAQPLATRLNRNLFGRLLIAILKINILLLFLAFVGTILFHEMTVLENDWVPRMERSFTWAGKMDVPSFYQRLSTIEYSFQGDGTELHKIKIGPSFQKLFIFFIVVFIFEFFIFLGQYRRGKKGNAQIIEAPLQEMADQADRLSRVELQEDKFHNIEDAIDSLVPGTPEARIDMGDKDLKGIEKALNNLLAKTHASYHQQIRFVSDASHELRTPIAVIQGYADMLARWGSEDEAVLEESIAAIRSEAQQMQALVEQLLFLARGDAGRNPMKREIISLSELISEIHEEYAMIDDKHEWKLEVKEDVFSYGDKSMLKQACRILIDNAKRYSDEGTPIYLSAFYDEESNSCLQVQDMGVGIAEEDLPQIFDRFYRSDPARKREGGGTGLGLSIAKWIVDQHKGHFNVLTRQDIGTRITIVLPKSN